MTRTAKLIVAMLGVALVASACSSGGGGGGGSSGCGAGHLNFNKPFPATQTFGATKDPEFSAATSRAYNRWLADYCKPYPQRLFGAAMLPMRNGPCAPRSVASAIGLSSNLRK